MFKVYQNFNLKFDSSNIIVDRKNDVNETEENKVLILDQKIEIKEDLK